MLSVVIPTLDEAMTALRQAERLALVVDAAHEAEAPQMDLFDVGGQTAAAGMLRTSAG